MKIEPYFSEEFLSVDCNLKPKFDWRNLRKKKNIEQVRNGVFGIQKSNFIEFRRKKQSKKLFIKSEKANFIKCLKYICFFFF